MLPYTKTRPVSLRGHPELNEKWIQRLIAEDPSILGLGRDIFLMDMERPQPRAGRLDLLLQDRETQRRYEVELQLGQTDESHIIRTLEYWDIERKRYPQYEHCAVLIAEDITSRFLNVISLFNGSVPLIAMQLRAFEIAGQIGVLFTTVLDEMPRGLVGEDERTVERTDRAYWEKRVPPASMKVLDSILPWIQQFRPKAQLNYNKHHVGIAEDGVADNFVYFHPQKKAAVLHVRIPQTEEVDRKLEETDLDTLPYDKNWGVYRLRLRDEDLRTNADLIRDLIGRAAREDEE